MTPRTPNPEIAVYRPVLSIEARDALMELAGALAFVVDQPGRYDGGPSVRELLESLAAAYERDPRGVRDTLIKLGVVWRPSPEDGE